MSLEHLHEEQRSQLTLLSALNAEHLQSVMASLDYANLAEYVSFGTADFNRIVDGLIAKN